jgi:hypothetical protein
MIGDGVICLRQDRPVALRRIRWRIARFALQHGARYAVYGFLVIVTGVLVAAFVITRERTFLPNFIAEAVGLTVAVVLVD